MIASHEDPAVVAATAGSQLGLGLLMSGAVGLIIGQIAGSRVGVLRLSRQVLARDRAAFPNSVYRSSLFDALTGALPPACARVTS